MQQSTGDDDADDVPRLTLSQSFLGPSSSKEGFGSVGYAPPRRGQHSLVARTSTDRVHILLDGLNLVDSLPFWSDYSSQEEHRKDNVECVCFSERFEPSGMFVAAAAGDCVVVWSTSANISGKETWQVHSRVHVGEGKISSIDIRKDLLLVGSQASLTLWKVSQGSRPSWRRSWRMRTPKRVVQSLFCPSEARFAVLLENDRRVCTWTLANDAAAKPESSGTLLHSRAVRQISWRREPEGADQTNIIVTRTIDGVTRLWASVIDEPKNMRIWSTIDPSAMGSNGLPSENVKSCFYLDAYDMALILGASLRWLQRDLQMADLGLGAHASNQQEKIMDLKRSRARRMEHLLSETPDMVALCLSDGTLVIRAVANIDRKPPTLCESFVVLRLASNIDLRSLQISSMASYAIATSASSNCYSPTGVLLLTLATGDMVKFLITPSLLFDGLGEGLSKTGSYDQFRNSVFPDHTSGGLDTLATAGISPESSVATTASSSSTSLVAVASTDGHGFHSVGVYDTRDLFNSTGLQTRYESKYKVTEIKWSSGLAKYPTLLALASSDEVQILAQCRTSYKDRLLVDSRAPRWKMIARIDVSTIGLSQIESIAWQSDCTLLLAASRLILKYDGRLAWPDRATQQSSSPQHMRELAAMHSSPLAGHEPEVIVQCLLWDRVGTACQVWINLLSAVNEMIPDEPSGRGRRMKDPSLMDPSSLALIRVQQTNIFDEEQQDSNKGLTQRTARLEHFLEVLQRPDTLSCFSRTQQGRLAHALDTTLKILHHRELLDVDAQRYLAAHFYLECSEDSLTLDYKSFLWALSSKSQGRLLQALELSYKGRLDWKMARRSGVFLWLRSHDDLRSLAEKVAQQQFSSQEERNPTSCSLLYFALGKQKLVWNLWRQSFWHADQKKMLQFLSNDFTLPRWQSAALKNAFALLSQRRFEMAASFFLLGNSLRDAVNVCIRNLGDFSLAVAIARLHEGGTTGPVFQDILRRDVLREALLTANRWLANWALQMLEEKELAIRVLCQPTWMLSEAFPALKISDKTQIREKEAQDCSHSLLLFSGQVDGVGVPPDLPCDIEARLLLQTHRTMCADGE
ncbi:hypothetical protein CBS101457_000439 [Exobasidium rhododendri]|nr:hypothetical protein CBS101457_000439 [Exobasidium rhododendri]